MITANPLKPLAFAAALLAALWMASTAMAHTDDVLDTLAAPNGGQLRMAGAYHLELVVAKNSREVTDNPVIVHVTDHGGNKTPTAGATGTVIILSNKTKINVKLSPDGDNRLKGMGSYSSSPDMKAVVSVTLADKTTEQARFVPLTPPLQQGSKQDGHSDHKH